MTDFSRVWAKVIEIAILVSPFLALIFGIDATPGIDGLAEVGVHLGAVIVAVKDFVQIIRGYFAAKPESIAAYVSMSYLDFERAVEVAAKR